jgi:ribosome maturation factor RimP
MNQISEKVKEIISPVLIQKDFELYDIEYKKEGSGWVLRIFVDNKSRNISLDDCAEISNLISELLDQDETLEFHSYSLEVSSPGLDRLLKSDADFNWAMSKTLKVKYLSSKDKKEVTEGKLLKFDQDSIELTIPKKDNVIIKRDSIESARRVMKFDELVPKDHK